MPLHKLFVLCIALFISIGASIASPISIAEVESTVYRLNNELRFEEAQELLLDILKRKELSADEKCHVYLLLSHTYKRLLDYESTLTFLDKAEEEAASSKESEHYMAWVKSEQAMAYFDLRDYKQAETIMNGLEASSFAGVSDENKAKLLMQQAYLLFLDTKYSEAEIGYEKAIQVMRLASPCDLPMIFVKQMQL